MIHFISYFKNNGSWRRANAAFNQNIFTQIKAGEIKYTETWWKSVQWSKNQQPAAHISFLHWMFLFEVISSSWLIAIICQIGINSNCGPLLHGLHQSSRMKWTDRGGGGLKVESLFVLALSAFLSLSLCLKSLVDCRSCASFFTRF